MMNNYPPGAENDPHAPYNEVTKLVEVDISVSLSSSAQIEVPEDLDLTDTETVKQIVKEQIMLPQDYTECNGDYNWVVDDFCVVV